MSTPISAEKTVPDKPKLFGVGTLVWALATAAMMLWAGAFPGIHMGYLLVALVLVMPAGVAWLILVIRTIRRKQFTRIIPAVPIIVVFSAVLAATGTVERLAFQLARPTLEQAVQNGTCPSWAGIMPIEACDVNDPSVSSVFIVNTEPVGLHVQEAGWVKIEGEERPRYGVSLGGRWYSRTFN